MDSFDFSGWSDMSRGSDEAVGKVWLALMGSVDSDARERELCGICMSVSAERLSECVS